jgi:serine/threonine-protein kinase
MDLRKQLQATLGNAYVLGRELGGGGMSRVFVADERRLGRDVVVKVLPPDVVGGISAERFEREIQLAARLQHPHIVPLLTAGEAEGLLYYTMPLVEGETLRDRMTREGRVPLAEALRIAAEVADALACAHRGGVVHRDIKPENILLSAGHAMVADFGIAKAISVSRTVAAGVSGDSGLTQLGTSLGTPAYMSPEQAAGESELDGRTDIYSLGCVLYEMLAGRQPFTGPTAAAIIAKRFMETPAPLRTIDGAIPADVEHLVERAMAREPEHRFATAGDALRSLSATLASCSGPRAIVDDKPSVAVLPFTNLSASADDEYFSDGMTEEVINALAHLPDIRVAARTSSFVFKGQRVDLRSIAEQLRVRTILEGSVRRAGNRVRISVQLVSATDGLHLWSERYDGDLADVFALQDEIAQAITRALHQRLGGASTVTAGFAHGLPPAPRERAPVKPEAYDVFLRGRFLFEQHKAKDALSHFERAAELDPSFALAYTWIGHGNILSANMNMIPARIAYPRARVAGEHAIALAPDVGEVRLTRAFVAGWFDWDRPRAEAIAREVLELAPGLSYAHEVLAWSLVAGERFDEGVASMERAYALDPLSDFMLYNFALTLVFARAETRVVEELRRGLARSPGSASLYLMLGFALFGSGRMSEARAAVERSRELAPPNQLTALQACILAAMGDTKGARKSLVEPEARAARGTGPAVEVACGYHWLGDDDAAFAWLERGFEARELWMFCLHLDPRLRRLRGDQRFDALIKRVGMAPRA